MPDIHENMFFFPGHDSVRLLGFTHLPDSAASETGILYCHPFAEEKNSSHFITANAARQFARLGFPVMRFDFSGCGDSEGEMHEFTIENWIDDIKYAAEHLKHETGVSNVALWGLRAGAAFALHASQNMDVHALLLWQPTFNLQMFMTQFLRNQVGANIANENQNGVSMKSLVEDLEAGETVEVFGYRLSSLLYKSFMTAETIQNIPPVNKTMLASISNMEKESAALSRFADKARQQGTDFEFVHVKEEPFWDRYERWQAEDVVKQSALWLKNVSFN